MPADLRPLLDHLPIWLMVLFRLTGIFLLAPVLGSPAILRHAKVFLVVGLSFCIYPMLLEPGREAATHLGSALGASMNLWTLGAAVGLELLIGLAIGYAATLPLIAMQVGGQLLDQQVFPGSAGVFNPDLNEESTVVGEFFFITATVVFVILGGHRVMLMTLVGSFDHIPLGGFEAFASLLQLMLGLLTAAFEIAIRIALPIICLIFLETLALGFVARTVPGLNILSVGFALRSVVGGLMLVICVGLIVYLYQDAVQFMLRRVYSFFAMS
ncbi:MAG: flagellar biosynthetic protein FliR [Phycisphaeraceae bacterium]